MSFRGDAERLQDILDAIAAISKYSEKITSEDELLQNEMVFQAILYNLMIIGEASDQLSVETKENYPNTEWHAIKSMRNIITHEYFRVKVQFVWDAIATGLAELKAEIEQMQRDLT